MSFLLSSIADCLHVICEINKARYHRDECRHPVAILPCGSVRARFDRLHGGRGNLGEASRVEHGKQVTNTLSRSCNHIQNSENEEHSQ